jgi:hypothetical protein
MIPAFSAAQIKPFVAIFQRLTNSVIHHPPNIHTRTPDFISTSQLIGQWRERLSSGEDIIDTTKWLSNLTLDALGEGKHTRLLHYHSF